MGFIVLAGCQNEGEAQSSAVKTYAYCQQSGFSFIEGTLNFCGRMDHGTSEELNKILELKSPELISINSKGGVVGEAIRMAELIHENQLNVLISQNCISACAHFILTAASDVTVEKDTLVGFHQTATATWRMLNDNDLIDKSALTNSYVELMEQELEFYRKFDLDDRWLSEPYWRMKPSCFSEMIYGKGGQIVGSRVANTKRAWTPRKEFIDSVRKTPIKGWWPNNPEEHNEAVKLRAKAEHIRRYMFQPDAHFRYVSSYKYTLPDCP